jgi:ABC-type Zn uptake system ZnuABC Zn-binding protein ZnuA
LIPGIDNNSRLVGRRSMIDRFKGLPSSGGALLAMAILATVTVVGCGGVTADTHKLLRVVTTTALLADLAQNVAGDSAKVVAVMPAGADVHSFQTTPNDSIEISKAGLIVSNGGGLDNFLNPMIENAMSDGAVHVVAAQGLAALSGSSDPHYWQNPANAVHYVRRIQEGLSAADPDDAEAYRVRADTYAQQLLDLDLEISRILEDVPQSRRHLVTYHDAFGHFGGRYGWRTSAIVSNDAGGITPGAITKLQQQVRQEGITAVFTEPQFRSKVIDLAAQDTGVEVGTIYSDVLYGSAATYIGMMRLNAENLAESLR